MFTIGYGLCITVPASLSSMVARAMLYQSAAQRGTAFGAFSVPEVQQTVVQSSTSPRCSRT